MLSLRICFIHASAASLGCCSLLDRCPLSCRPKAYVLFALAPLALFKEADTEGLGLFVPEQAFMALEYWLERKGAPLAYVSWKNRQVRLACAVPSLQTLAQIMLKARESQTLFSCDVLWTC